MRDNNFNPETILELFLNSFFEVVNLHAPLRTLTIVIIQLVCALNRKKAF